MTPHLGAPLVPRSDARVITSLNSMGSPPVSAGWHAQATKSAWDGIGPNGKGGGPREGERPVRMRHLRFFVLGIWPVMAFLLRPLGIVTKIGNAGWFISLPPLSVSRISLWESPSPTTRQREYHGPV